jgi:hypothetical protein
MLAISEIFEETSLAKFANHDGIHIVWTRPFTPFKDLEEA